MYIFVLDLKQMGLRSSRFELNRFRSKVVDQDSGPGLWDRTISNFRGFLAGCGFDHIQGKSKSCFHIMSFKNIRMILDFEKNVAKLEKILYLWSK